MEIGEKIGRILIDRSMELDFVYGFDFANLGIRSPIKFYADRILGFPPDARQIKILLSCNLEKKASSVGGVPTGATSWAAKIADELEIPEFGFKEYEVTGARKPGKRPFLIEDVVTTGASLDKYAGIFHGHFETTTKGFAIFSYGFRKDILALSYFSDVRNILGRLNDLNNYEVEDGKSGLDDKAMMEKIDEWYEKAKERYERIHAKAFK